MNIAPKNLNYYDTGIFHCRIARLSRMANTKELASYLQIDLEKQPVINI